MSFPLFNNLLSESLNKNLTNTQKNYFMNNFKKLDQDGINLMYALIISYNLYELKNPKLNEMDLTNELYISPYSSKILSNNEIEFDLDNLPKKLNQILYKFIVLHIKKMKEDKKK